MWQSTIRRKQFLEVLQRDQIESSQEVREATREDRLREGEIRLLWAKEPRAVELPFGLVVRESEVDDFFAWTNTYLPNWCPITANFRVLSDKEPSLEAPRLNEKGARLLETASIGLIIAEAISQAVESYDMDRLSVAGCMATFSFAASQGLMRNVSATDVAHQWSECRKITGQAPLRLEARSLLPPWEAVNELVTSEPGSEGRKSGATARRLFATSLREIIATREIGPATWNRLTIRFPSARKAIIPMRGTQEERVAVLEGVLREKFGQRHRNMEETSFIVGYLASRIFPGTIKHAGLLLEHLESFPNAVLWLGLFASLHGRRELNMSSLGRRIWRALSAEKTIISRPRCDIALRELLVLVEGGVFGVQYKTETPGRLVVELQPCIETVVRWPVHEQVRESHRQGELFGNRAIELGDMIRDLREVRNRLDNITQKMERLTRR